MTPYLTQLGEGLLLEARVEARRELAEREDRVGCVGLGQDARELGCERAVEVLAEAGAQERLLAARDAVAREVLERLHEQQRVRALPGLDDRGVAPEARECVEALLHAVAAEQHHRLGHARRARARARG